MKMKGFALYMLLFCGFTGNLLLAQTTVHSFSHGGLTRSYRLHIPTNYTGNTPVPLVFNLHGYTSNAQQQELYSEMNAVSDTAGFIVCYPDGVNNAWNSGFTFPYYGGIDDVGFISRLIDEIAGQYNVNLARVYSCGMSNGGFMSFRLACDLESRIAAIASVTGSMSPLQTANCNLSRPVPVMQVHGTADATVPYVGAAGMEPVDTVMAFWRTQNGCPGAPTVTTLPDLVFEGSTITTYHNTGCTDSTEVLHYKVGFGGHSWPGAVPIPNLGLTNQDIECSVEIWKFFNRFSHPAPLAVSNAEPNHGEARIYPNPALNGFVLENIEAGMNIQVYSMDGLLVFSEKCLEQSIKIDADLWNAGVYWVVVKADGYFQSLKWVKSGQ